MTDCVRKAYADTSLGQVHYAEAGSGPVLVLLHQTPRSHDEFRELQPLLAAEHRVLALDMPGFGQSVRLPAPQTIEAFAGGVLAFLDALGLAEVAVLGHHTGGAVGIELAARIPERVRSLVLSSTPWTGPEYRAAHAGRTTVDEVAPTEDGQHLVEMWGIRRPYYPPGRADLRDRFLHDALAPGVDPAEGHRACVRYRMEERIGLVRAPVLLIGGEADPFALPDLPRLERRLVHAGHRRVTTVAGGMVPLMEQCPEQVAAAVLPFLRD
ncbi:alpha/beta fold hydrolase [Amycolatopsis jiangsuensis]|uniref:Pimeloyl-ACP methyl ester carboxylesterase n=1 Tax=Amycolatopsis jiangsuensis TaxID=1181879 RepID=A0A840IND9_9PSEU|nr:alpha/beta hydrolase [Amycolatopsis jiangsuensis]MBB4683876.1 pimeloyl-ACP methyl ester carboxylesterase [Amycolatopsis jiangsuensis]